MIKHKLQQGEDEFIHFLIDPDAVSPDENDNIVAEYRKEIEDWQGLIGKPPVLQKSRWQKIKAGFWQQAEEPEKGYGKFHMSLAGLSVALVLFFLVGPIPEHTVSNPDGQESAISLENDHPQASFESLADMLMPVAPLSESIWFIANEEDQGDDLLEELILITNNLTGEFS